MTRREIEDALAQGRPEINWAGEPAFGSVYGEEEIAAALRTMRGSFSPEVGFRTSGSEGEPFEAEFAAYCGAGHAVSLNSAGSGLDIAMRALDLEPDDEVICPSINFKAAPLSIVGAGGRWVPCEVDPATLQADPRDVEARVTSRTRAILPVHMNGLSAPIAEIIDIAERHSKHTRRPIVVVGDAARALGGGYRGGKIGGFGDMTVFSFQTQKNMTTLGEGGAITTNDPELAARLRRIRFFGGDTEWGGSYLMTNVQAAVGRVQLRKLDGLVEARRKLAATRTELLRGLPELTLPSEPGDCVHSYYLYTILTPEDWAGAKRDALCNMLREHFHVNTVIANPPVHSSVAFLAEHTGRPSMPLSEQLGARLFCPPIHPAMSESDNRYICAAIWKCVEQLRAG